MRTVLYRAIPALQPGDGRTVFGMIVPYSKIAVVSDGGPAYREQFDYGSFTRTLAERGSKIRLYEGHLTNLMPLGRAAELKESFDGVHGSFEISKTRAGDDALTLIHSGVADSFSISFTPLRERQDHGVTIRTECRLEEVSLVGRPAYAEAKIVGVRSAPPAGVIPRSIAEARLRLASRERFTP